MPLPKCFKINVVFKFLDNKQFHLFLYIINLLSGFINTECFYKETGYSKEFKIIIHTVDLMIALCSLVLIKPILMNVFQLVSQNHKMNRLKTHPKSNNLNVHHSHREASNSSTESYRMTTQSSTQEIFNSNSPDRKWSVNEQWDKDSKLEQENEETSFRRSECKPKPSNLFNQIESDGSVHSSSNIGESEEESSINAIQNPTSRLFDLVNHVSKTRLKKDNQTNHSKLESSLLTANSADLYETGDQISSFNAGGSEDLGNRRRSFKSKKYFKTNSNRIIYVESQSWLIFDTIMVIAIWSSLLRSVIKTHYDTTDHLTGIVVKILFVLKIPRPLMIVRYVNYIESFQITQAKIAGIVRKVSHQLKGVTVFLAFFIVLYAILGVQFFGRIHFIEFKDVEKLREIQNISLNSIYKHECTSSNRSLNGLFFNNTDCSYFDYHCVNVGLLKHYLSNNNTNCGTLQDTMTSRLNDMSDLGEAFTQEIRNPCRQIFAIPDRLCYYELINESRENQKDGKVSTCGNNLRCRKISFEEDKTEENIQQFQRGVRQAKFTAFDTLMSSIFTVYESASQETWVYMMYNCTSAFNPVISQIYFVSLIFLLAWLVKNVFIAVIIETSADIRTQFNNIWTNIDSKKGKRNLQGSWFLTREQSSGTSRAVVEMNRRPGQTIVNNQQNTENEPNVQINPVVQNQQNGYATTTFKNSIKTNNYPQSTSITKTNPKWWEIWKSSRNNSISLQTQSSIMRSTNSRSDEYNRRNTFYNTDFKSTQFFVCNNKLFLTMRKTFRSLLKKYTDKQFWKKVLTDKNFEDLKRGVTLSSVLVAAVTKKIEMIDPDGVFTTEERENYYFYYRLFERSYTAILNLELLLRIYAFGWNASNESPSTITVPRPDSMTKSSLIWDCCLAVMCTFSAFTIHTFLPVFRIVNIMKISPTFWEFILKCFGPMQKMGFLLFFNMLFTILASALSLELFEELSEGDENFEFRDFPLSLRSMFQIMTQEGWLDVKNAVLNKIDDFYLRFLAEVYFMIYHFLATMVIVSMFVALILDNLELTEDNKRKRQLKMATGGVDTKLRIPLRYAIFKKFPDKPEMVKVKNNLSIFEGIKIRKSEMDELRASVSKERSEPDLYKQPMLPHMIKTQKDFQAWQKYEIEYMLMMDEKRKMDNKKSEKIETKDGVRKHLGKGNYSEEKESSDLVNNEEILGENSIWGDEGQYVKRIRKCRDPKYINKRFYAYHPMQPRLTASLSGQKYFQKDSLQGNRQWDMDFKLARQKKQQVELQKIRLENDLHENHPFFDKPFFIVKRDGLFRNICKKIVYSRYGETFDLKSKRYNPEEIQQTNFGQSNNNFGQNDRGDSNWFFRYMAKGLKTGTFVQRNLSKMPYLDLFMTFLTSVSVAFICQENALLWEKVDNEGCNGVSKNGTLTVSPDNCWRLLDNPDYSNIHKLKTYTARFHFTEHNHFRIMELIYLCFMTFEIFVKLIADGMILTPRAYLTDGGAYLDVFIYITSIFNYITNKSTVIQINSIGYYLLVARSLRPLRIFRLVPPVRKVAVDLRRGGREIFLVIMLLVTFVFVFATVGHQLFGGQNLEYCNDVTRIVVGNNRSKIEEQCSGMYKAKVYVNSDFTNLPGPQHEIWVKRELQKPRNFSFDSISLAMLTLFEALSLKGWVELRDVLSKLFPWTGAIYIFIFVYFGWLILLTLFIGVIVSNYNKNRGIALLTVEQRRFEDLKKRLKLTKVLTEPPRPAENSFYQKCYDLKRKPWYDKILTGIILIQAMTLCTKWTGEIQHRYNADSIPVKHVPLGIYLAKANAIIMLFFAINLFVKLAANEMRIGRNLMLVADLFLVSFSLIWAGYIFMVDKRDGDDHGDENLKNNLTQIQQNNEKIENSTSWSNNIRNIGVLLSLIRFGTIVDKHNTLEVLVQTVLHSVRRSLFILLAIISLTFSFGLGGVVLFGSVRYGESLDSYANFRTSMKQSC